MKRQIKEIDNFRSEILKKEERKEKFKAIEKLLHQVFSLSIISLCGGFIFSGAYFLGLGIFDSGLIGSLFTIVFGIGYLNTYKEL